MGEVIDINKDRHFIRFFSEPVECDWCDEETYGLAFERMQSVICSKCRQPLFVIEEHNKIVVTMPDGTEMEFDADDS